ncbi:MAG: sugar phosphate isomerase/epimerase family protein [Nitrospirota bacterium]
MEPLHIHVPYPVLKDSYDFIKLHRYDLEIYFSSAVLDHIVYADLEQVVTSLDWKPALTLHAPFTDINPGAVDTLVRSVTQLRFRQLLNVASILKPRSIVFHAAYDKWRYSWQADAWTENSIETWQKVMETASKIGVRVAVENVFDEDPDALEKLITRINSPDFGFCFDIGHFNLFSKCSMEEWFERLGRHLIEVHLHDNDGTADAHWALGRGTINFEQFFHLLKKYSAIPVFTIEAHNKDDIETSLQQAALFLNSQFPVKTYA